ncbi:Dps family protein [Facklamia sp. 7083-14-GEN3]|uniref:Dps family protein n=1 Tax=Facklamia sp. 7083-14-GEN3 TaxID=2973478 RepID=UPI00215C9A34|nr:DNA starvation/stationary phase protection protein [Facklamia sp. 7083-14-GEN3]MCR8969080.1 DNA starvation/stationary phase protection protein [Facklamia sp. 7083-14-GEN3]
MSEKVFELLNKVVATQGVFYVRLHQFHWFVKGSHFFTLHEKFEELYDQVTADMDEVAERLLAIGGQPYATVAEFIEHSAIKENAADKDLDQDEMVAAIVKDIKTLISLYDEGIHLTDEAEDFPSNDMLIALKTESEKTIWMLNAYLNKRATE